MTDNINTSTDWKFAVAWIIAVVVIYLMALVLILLYFGVSIILLFVCFKVLPEIMFLAVVGYTIVNLAAIMRLSNEEREQLVKFAKNKVVFLISVIAMNVDFILASIIGNWIYAVASVGLLIPLVWFSIESWLIDKGLWYLTPAGLIAGVLIVPLKTRIKVTSTYFLAGAGILPLTGKVQKSLT